MIFLAPLFLLSVPNLPDAREKPRLLWGGDGMDSADAGAFSSNHARNTCVTLLDPISKKMRAATDPAETDRLRAASEPSPVSHA